MKRGSFGFPGDGETEVRKDKGPRNLGAAGAQKIP